MKGRTAKAHFCRSLLSRSLAILAFSFLAAACSQPTGKEARMQAFYEAGRYADALEEFANPPAQERTEVMFAIAVPCAVALKDLEATNNILTLGQRFPDFDTDTVADWFLKGGRLAIEKGDLRKAYAYLARAARSENETHQAEAAPLIFDVCAKIVLEGSEREGIRLFRRAALFFPEEKEVMTNALLDLAGKLRSRGDDLGAIRMARMAGEFREESQEAVKAFLEEANVRAKIEESRFFPLDLTPIANTENHINPAGWGGRLNNWEWVQRRRSTYGGIPFVVGAEHICMYSSFDQKGMRQFLLPLDGEKARKLWILGMTAGWGGEGTVATLRVHYRGGGADTWVLDEHYVGDFARPSPPAEPFYTQVVDSHVGMYMGLTPFDLKPEPLEGIEVEDFGNRAYLLIFGMTLDRGEERANEPLTR